MRTSTNCPRADSSTQLSTMLTFPSVDSTVVVPPLMSLT
eukprot:SAG25_NODE_98_length_15733_cov_18.939237_6_plen_39_part_00